VRHSQDNSRKRGAAGADLDPDIRRFVTRMGESWAHHPALDTISPAQARKIAELVRAPWAAGGPVMHRTREHFVPCGEQRYVRVRVHEPLDRPLGPALIYLHGGGWTIFSIDTHDRVMREYAHRAQVAVVGVDYSLSPETKFPQALQEISAVVAWLRQHGAALGMDPRALCIGGDSAGANLAIATALALRDAQRGDALRAMLLNYGAFDSTCDYPSYDVFGGAGYMLGDTEMAAFWRNYLGSDSDEPSPLACPLRARLQDLPPAYLAVAECDVLYDENILMIGRLKAAGVAVTANVYGGVSHSFLEAVSISHIADRAFDDAATWLRSVL
jgi:acetyl esterase